MKTQHTCTPKEIRLITREFGIDSDDDLRYEFEYWRYDVVCGHHLFLSVDYDKEFSFLVDWSTVTGSVDYTEAWTIWRWFIRAFKDLVGDLDECVEYHCFPESEDGRSCYFRRVKLFSRLGFKLNNWSKMTFTR